MLKKLIVTSPRSIQNKVNSTQQKQTNHKSSNSFITSNYQSYFMRNKQKPISLSFNMGRIMPKPIDKQKQELYEQNLKLKSEVKYLQKKQSRWKTITNISQSRVDKAIKLRCSEHQESERAKSKNSKNLSLMCLQSQNHLRIQVRQLKEIIENLQAQNQKMRKSIKYTQIKQLSVQNENLKQQCWRLKEKIRNASYDNERLIKSQQKQIMKVKDELLKQKQNNQIISSEIKSLRAENNGLKVKVFQLQAQIQEYIQRLKPTKEPIENFTLINTQTQTNKDTKPAYQEQKNALPIKEKQINDPIYHHRNRSLQTNLKSSSPKAKANQKNLEKQLQILMLKETLTYRFQALRYTFDDLVSDIEKSEFAELTTEQMIKLLKGEPFHLQNPCLSTTLSHIFESKYQPFSRVSIKTFLTRFRSLISDFQLISQHKQQHYLQKWRKILKKHKKKQGIDHKNGNRLMRVEEFKQWLIQIQISNEEFELLIGQCCLVSERVDKLNLQKFIEKITT